MKARLSNSTQQILPGRLEGAAVIPVSPLEQGLTPAG
jgi:hypothetical protein